MKELHKNNLTPLERANEKDNGHPRKRREGEENGEPIQKKKLMRISKAYGKSSTFTYEKLPEHLMLSTLKDLLQNTQY